jgi:hypothetical protein
MKLPFIFAFLFCVGLSIAMAQTDKTTEVESAEKKERLATTYLGVQANQLIRQIFNFSNSNSAIDNPYLFIYSVNSKETGVGFSSGLGFSVSHVSDGDPSNKRETKINNLSLRVGVEKKSSIGKKWLVSWGFDITHDNLKNETSNTQSFNPNNTSVFTTTNTTSSWGIGPRFTLNFQVTNRILLATEANYYYKSGSTATTSSNTSPSFSSKIESSNDFTKFQFTVPAVIYLIVKF